MKTIKSKLGVPDSEWKLGSIGSKSGSILDKELPLIQTPAKFSNIKRRPNKTITKDLVELVIEQHNVSIKDYGEIYRILADERLYGLLKYHKNETVLASDLKNEIEKYDEKRVKVFEDIMNYEKKITNGVTDRQLCESMDHAKDIDFKVMQTFDTMNDNLTKMELRSIRNAFCHNSYPDVNAFDNSSGTTKRIRIHNADIPGTAEKISEIVNDISSKTEAK